MLNGLRCIIIGLASFESTEIIDGHEASIIYSIEYCSKAERKCQSFYHLLEMWISSKVNTSISPDPGVTYSSKWKESDVARIWNG